MYILQYFIYFVIFYNIILLKSPRVCGGLLMLKHPVYYNEDILYYIYIHI